MKPRVRHIRRMVVWLGVACLGLVPLSPLSARQPKLRATLGGGHAAAVTSVAFSPDGKLLASAGYDKAIKLWDMPAARLADK